ncbi:MAG: peptide chain release factor N(5)-glutamine methyltransferase [Thermosynechococcaceae cyanobacterium]
MQVSGEDLWAWRQQALQAISHWTEHPQEQVHYGRELDWLLTAIAPLDRLALRLETFRAWPCIALDRSLADLSDLWQQRLQDKVPLQYLLGWTTWRDFTLEVGPGVLIPRPETELLIDLAQAAVDHHPHLQPSAPMQWADLGTGSGAIALGLARSFPNATIHAVDCSPIALAIAQRNAERWDLAHRIRFYQGSWLEPLGKGCDRLDGIVSNPPYIPSLLMAQLQPEVAHHEPTLALDGGADGLDAIRTIVNQAPQSLGPNGILLLEMMMGQAQSVETLLKGHEAYSNAQIHLDWAGIQRFAQAMHRES